MMLGALISPVGAAEPAKATPREDYIRVPMPPGFQVVATELEGPVFANDKGLTLYIWPYAAMRVGSTGDQPNMSACSYTPTTETAGMMSPYPAGLQLPELEKRPSCAQAWPPALAADSATAVGSFGIITRADGKKQWTFNRQPLYTSALDKVPGDVLGGTTRREGGENNSPAERNPIGPPPNVPPGFAVTTTPRGRLLVTEKNFSVFASNRDAAGKSNCDAVCARTWQPIIAPATTEVRGEWSVVERGLGVRQWAYRGQPLYTYANDRRPFSYRGGDVPGWRNVFTQAAPPLPPGFRTMDNEVGEVVTDPRGMTIYYYTCADDSKDQLACDYPEAPQAYRIAVCGGGSVELCSRTWRYVEAPPGVRSTSRAWSTLFIDASTGKPAAQDQANALRVWAYRGRPLYLFSGDKMPGDIEGNHFGEVMGKRNGFRAFLVRDDFFSGSR